MLLLEDRMRRLRLDQLEAQCYRWLIGRDVIGLVRWPPHDPKPQMPHDALARCADVLGRWLLSHGGEPDAAMVFWRRETDRVRADVLYEKPSYELEQRTCGWRIVWNRGVENDVLEMCRGNLYHGTGGVILGRVDEAAKTIYVVHFCAPPDDSSWTISTFTRGSHHVSKKVKRAGIQTGGVVRCVGEWREHPDAMFPIPGRNDVLSLAEARDEMGVTSHPPLILIIGENDIEFHMLLN